MNIIKGNFAGKRGRAYKNWLGKPMLAIGGTHFLLTDPSLHITHIKSERRVSASALTAAIGLILLAFWLTGPLGLLTVPVLLCGRRWMHVVDITHPTMPQNRVVLNQREWLLVMPFANEVG